MGNNGEYCRLKLSLEKAFAVVMAFCLVFSPALTQNGVYAATEAASSYDNMSDSQKQQYLEQQLKETNKKLTELAGQSTDTQEYLNALDTKISYLNKQISIIKNKVNTAQTRTSNLQKQYDKNHQDILELGSEIDAMSAQIDALEQQFTGTYDEYCKRIRAMYVSGETTTLEALLTSGDLSQLLTRLEMIKCVSKQDSQLMNTIKEQSNQLSDAKVELDKKSAALVDKQSSLDETKIELDRTMTELNSDIKSMQSKESSLATEQDSANSLLKTLNNKTKEYTEYRDSAQEDLNEIDAAIAQAAEKYTTKKQTTKKQTTTKKKTTTKKETSAQTSIDETGSATTEQTTQTTQTTTTATVGTSWYISLTFPIPSQTRITTAFHGYSGHSGCDFSCASGSKVVAAESGTVIVSADLKNSDGTYRSYGRYIVIAHDKTTASGKAVYTLYAHNSSRLVSAGTHVEKGQQIAKSGSTGNSTGPHCHFEVRTPSSSYNDCVNPANYLP